MYPIAANRLKPFTSAKIVVFTICMWADDCLCLYSLNMKLHNFPSRIFKFIFIHIIIIYHYKNENMAMQLKPVLKSGKYCLEAVVSLPPIKKDEQIRYFYNSFLLIFLFKNCLLKNYLLQIISPVCASI